MSIRDTMRDQAVAMHHPAKAEFERVFGPAKRFMMTPAPLGFDVIAFDEYLIEQHGFDPDGGVTTHEFVADKTSTWCADWLLHLVAPQSLPLPPTHPSSSRPPAHL